MLLDRRTKESRPGYELDHTFARPFSLAFGVELLSASDDDQACI
jgi:hypothetical protein